MKIRLSNLGSIKQADFELGDFTIICGENNTGKTYATYALFGFLHQWQALLRVSIEDLTVEALLNDGVVKIDLLGYLDDYEQILQQACEQYTKLLPKIFTAPVSHFSNTSFQIELDEKPALLSSYDINIQSENADIFSLSKLENSTELVVSLLAGIKKAYFPTTIIKGFISFVTRKIFLKRIVLLQRNIQKY
ncbi:MAG: AAA family ATPase [Mariprofundales bacterium]